MKTNWQFFNVGSARFLCLFFVLGWALFISKIGDKLVLEQNDPSFTRLTLTPKKSRYLLGAPTGVEINITNVSEEKLYYKFDYPKGMDLEITPQEKTDEAHIKAKPLNWKMPDGTQRFLSLKPGEAYKATLFLNRVLTFIDPGKYDLKYSLSLTSYGANEQGQIDGKSKKVLSSTGSLQIVIDKENTKELDEDLQVFASYISNISELRRKPIQMQKMLEAVEALSYLETPLVDKYLYKMLHIDGAEISAIAALRRLNRPESITKIASVIPTKDPDVLEEALSVLIENKVLLNLDETKAALEFIDPWDVKGMWLMLHYLGEVGNKTYIPIVEPYQQNENKFISDSANEAIKKLKAKP